MSNEKTLVFDIEKFAVHDGPGIRTVVFMKGCPLHCIWCHNPESQSFNPELLFDAGKCNGCGRCAAVCPGSCHAIRGTEHSFARNQCSGCGVCAENCPSEALKLAGREMSVDDVMEEVMKDQVFYQNSGGGLTLSGGEPLAHFEFTFALLKAAKAAGLHTAVETCGFAPWGHLEELLDLVDLWLWDIKAPPEKHESLTGVPFEPILDNLKHLSAAKAEIILRCPMIPGINDEDSHLLRIARLANELEGVQGIDLEPYHPMGEGKGRRLNRDKIFHADFASAEDKKRWEEILSGGTSVPLRIY